MAPEAWMADERPVTAAQCPFLTMVVLAERVRRRTASSAISFVAVPTGTT